MQKREIYVAFDGKEFESEVRCKEYEDYLKENEKRKKKIITLKSGKELTGANVEEFFQLLKCPECPFDKECHEMEERIRRHTTDTFCLCDVINPLINL